MKALQIISVQETRRLLTYSALIDEIAKAVEGLRNKMIAAPERMAMNLPDDGVLLLMPATDGEIGITKLITVLPHNPSRQLPGIQGEVLVFHAKTGETICILDAPTVTARRTAAVTLYGLRLLGCATPRKILIVGTGTQAREHALALSEVCDPKHIFVAGLNRKSAEDFVASFDKAIPALVAVPHADEVRKEVDLIVTLTTSKTPVFSPDIPDSTFVVGIGAFRPDMIELPPELVLRRKVVVDHFDGARREAGDLLNAGVDWDSVSDFASLNESGDMRPYLLKTVGHAAWDLTAARLAISRIGLR